MAIVDFDTYTEQDLSGEITVTPTKIDVIDFAIDEVAYVTKDYGADYFGDFIHRQKTHFESATNDGGNAGVCLVWSLVPDTYHSRQDIFDNTNGLMIEMGTGAIDVVNLRTFPGNNQDFYTIPSVPVDFWFEIERVSTTLTCKIYSDAYSTLITTLSVSCSADTMRWHNAVAGIKTGADADTITAYVEDFDPEPSIGAIVEVKKNFHMITRPVINMTGPPSTGMGQLT